MAAEHCAGSIIAARYRLDAKLGQGGMGSVWSATHIVTRSRVAMKFLRAGAAHRPEMRGRLLREARAASAVRHPHVIEVHDVFDLDDGTPVLVMALLQGETLASYLSREAPLALPAVCDLLVPVLSAVGTAHSVGVVHRDLKPDNVFLSYEGGKTVVRVLDFGIAKLATALDASEGATLTVTGATLGTPCYMAPEQGFGEDVDHRADIWAIGAMLYEALTGGRPVEGDNLGQVLKRFMMQGITPISALVPNLPVPVGDLVMAMLARDREERPSDLREVLSALSPYTRVTVPEFGPPAAWGTAAANDLGQADGGPNTTDDAMSASRHVTQGSHSISVATSLRPARRTVFAAVTLLVIISGTGAAVLLKPPLFRDAELAASAPVASIARNVAPRAAPTTAEQPRAPLPSRPEALPDASARRDRPKPRTLPGRRTERSAQVAPVIHDAGIAAPVAQDAGLTERVDPPARATPLPIAPRPLNAGLQEEPPF